MHLPALYIYIQQANEGPNLADKWIKKSHYAAATMNTVNAKERSNQYSKRTDKHTETPHISDGTSKATLQQGQGCLLLKGMSGRAAVKFYPTITHTK